MPTTTPVERSVSPAQSPQRQAADRLLSLDAYRGLIMFILVSNGLGISALAAYPQWKWLADQFEHSEWTGITFWDLIQPAFTFMVGVAMPFALERRRREGATFGALFRHVCWRALMLIALSNLFSNFGEDHLRLQLINVLSQIAFGYVICFLVLQCEPAWQVVAAVALLAGQWALFAMFPGPQGAFSQTGNIGQVIDRAVLGYTYQGYYVTINFLGNAVTILFGCWTGVLLRARRPPASTLKSLGLGTVACCAIGFALAPFNPDVKRLWTASFTFLSAAWVIAAMAALYWLIDVRGWKQWTFPFVVLGMNSIFVYGFWQLLGGWLDRGLVTFTKRFAFFGPAGEIPHRFVVVGVMWGLCYWLYRRRIFLKA
jgi:heparan-alpha-glucosaminide N-acetyltransferase